MLSITALAKRIRQAREYSDITQVQMAKNLNLARQTYLDIESGKTEPKVSSLITIAELTGRPINWLVYGETDQLDLALTHQHEINELLMLFDDLPASARELVIQQSYLLADHVVKSDICAAEANQGLYSARESSPRFKNA